MGPYTREEIDDNLDKRKSGCLYLVSGLTRYEHGSPRLQYIGISERGAAVRFHDKDHKSELISRERQFWLGHFSNLNQEATRSNLELAEHALVYACEPERNVAKIFSPPRKPVVVINRWFTQEGYYREKRLYPAQKEVPDVIVYDGESFWKCDRLKLLGF